MMSAPSPTVLKPSGGVDPAILAAVHHHLEGLKKTNDGKVLYHLIERGLHRYGNNGQIENTFITFVSNLLRKYTQHPNSDPATRFKARVIQQRLALNMPYTGPMESLAAVPVVLKTHAHPEHPPAQPLVAPPVLKPAVTTAAPVALPRLLVKEAPPMPAQAPAAMPPAAADAPTVANVNNIEGMFVSDIEHLIEGYQQLGFNLQRASEYLRTLESDRHELQRQLHQVRTHSLVDSLTHLPNRMAFMRQVTAEIERAKRYGGKLSVALIALDGADNTDATSRERVLTLYASRVLTHFRAYDVVARYSADTFAVVFPNTSEADALRALEKLRAQIALGATDLQGRKWPLPAFSAAVALYRANEKPTALIRRADVALAGLGVRGAGTTVIAPPPV